MIIEPRVPLFDLIECLSKAMDLVCPSLVNHHERVAYIAYCIGTEASIDRIELGNIVLAGALHDSGALSINDRLKALQFDIDDDASEHAELGYLLLRNFEPLRTVARLVRYHHVPWSLNDKTEQEIGEEIPLGSHVLHLADRIAVLIHQHGEILGQVSEIRTRILERCGTLFAPHLVEAFLELAEREVFWLDAASESVGAILKEMAGLDATELGLDGMLSLSNLFRQIIDFRSRFTATHSLGVAASAEALAREFGFSDRECLMMRVAGYLHDLGKLAVPSDILEKAGPLTSDEMGIVRSHTYYTYRILEPIPGLGIVNAWAAFHHERIDGTGYPFHHKGQDLSLGSRIMAVADVFTALTEDRPYRAGLPKREVLGVLRDMAKGGALDNTVVEVLERRYRGIDAARISAQTTAGQEYQELAPWSVSTRRSAPPRASAAARC